VSQSVQALTGVYRVPIRLHPVSRIHIPFDIDHKICKRLREDRNAPVVAKADFDQVGHHFTSDVIDIRSTGLVRPEGEHSEITGRTRTNDRDVQTTAVASLAHELTAHPHCGRSAGGQWTSRITRSTIALGAGPLSGRIAGPCVTDADRSERRVWVGSGGGAG